jgi:microcystin-dependent protein
MHEGSGPGLTNRRLGEKGGSETVPLTQQQIPSHTHTVAVNCSDQPGTADAPTGQVWSGSSEGDQGYTDTGTPNQTMGAQAVQIGNAGGGQSHNNLQPYQCVNFIIALQGTFPSRN